MAVFQQILVANRGEIALRVIRTARELGIGTVAIFTDVDACAPHVVAADQAVEITSYLDIDAVVEAARVTGAEAIHPGYGFLSERAAFARAVEAAGLVLVGPSAEVMETMGRKDTAREIAIAAGVAVVPRGEDAGFPVLVKAAAGGGGKGMRVVRTPEEYDEAVAAARREAAAAFGDDTMLLEKYVEHGRHIEVQVLADAHGNVVHLFERDCSTQRRHQKVLEEAPAPTITPEVRERVTSAAVALAAHVGYVNAGTVEFLVDMDPGGAFGGSPGGASPGVYFLEMNTRLQVEHPVTEMAVQISGQDLDLVELQLRVAAGEELSITQDDVRLDGHAIEARVYAEDSFGGFLPQAGTATIVRWPGFETVASPTSSTTVRVDHALESGQVVGTSYDPMLGKIIAHGPDRESARQALVGALDDTVVLGLTTNAGFLRALVASEEFRDATIDTAWLDTATVPAPDLDVPRALVAWVSALLSSLGPAEAFQPDGFRLGGPPAPTRVELDRDVLVDRSAGTIDGVPFHQVSAENHTLIGDLGGERVRVVANLQPDIVEAAWRGQRHVFTPPDRLAGAVAVSDGSITSPMPGTVLEVRVVEGQEVADGEPLGTMEAMKMELTLRAPFAGSVTRVDAVTGVQVPIGAPLFTVEAPGTGEHR